MAAYLEKAKKLMGIFPTIFVEVISWAKNTNVNTLAKLASTKDAKLLDVVSIEFLVEPSIRQQPEVMALVQESLWMDPIVAYLKNGEVSEGKIEARILRLKFGRYILYDDKLYQRGYSVPLLRCVPDESKIFII